MRFAFIVASGGTAYIDDAIGYATLAPDGWTITGAGAVVQRDEGRIKSGKCSAKLTRVGNDSFINNYASLLAKALTGGKTYVVAGWMYQTVANRGYIGISNPGVAAASSTSAVINEWVYVTASYSYPA
jgi:hypothetical protein